MSKHPVARRPVARPSAIVAALAVTWFAGCGDPTVGPDVRDAGTDVGSDAADVPVAMDVVPEAGCPMGQTLCSGACVNTQTDNGNCGS